jgi:hypothetical protein
LAAAKLNALGVKGILIKAAEQGYISGTALPTIGARRSERARRDSRRASHSGGSGRRG